MIEPMSDERLREIRKRLDYFRATGAPNSPRADAEALLVEVERAREIIEQQHEWIHQLVDEQPHYMSENAALTTENARMREIVQAVAGMPTPSAVDDAGFSHEAQCPWCKKMGQWLGSRIQHTSDCPVTKARAILEK